MALKTFLYASELGATKTTLLSIGCGQEDLSGAPGSFSFFKTFEDNAA
jgi:hypothetical protein